MFGSSVKAYGHQNYQNPLFLRSDPIFVTQIIVLIALVMLISIISFFYSRYCSYPQFACSLSSKSSRQKIRQYAQIGGLLVLENTTRDNNTKSPMGEGGGGVITTGNSPIEVGEKSRHIKGSSHVGPGLGQGQGQELWGPERSIESPDTEMMHLATVVNDAIEAVKEDDNDIYQSPSRKISLTARRTAFLEFLAKTEYHQTSPGEEQSGGEEDDDDDTVIVPRHYSFSRGMEVFGIKKTSGRHNSIA